jgi:hypothetical protein
VIRHLYCTGVAAAAEFTARKKPVRHGTD